MCYILFHVVYEGCDHEDFLDGRRCGVYDCEVNHDYVVNLEDSGYACEQCALVERMLSQDLNVSPVQYYPPTACLETKMEKVPGRWHPKVIAFPKTVFETEPEYGDGSLVDEDLCSDGNFSDLDSVTSHWKLRHPMYWVMEEYETDLEGSVTEEEGTQMDDSSSVTEPQEVGDNPAEPRNSSPFKLTPRTLKHRHLVEEQLSGLPKYHETMMHRYLIDEQLAMLPRKPSQPLQPNAQPFHPHVPVQNVWRRWTPVSASHHGPLVTALPLSAYFKDNVHVRDPVDPIKNTTLLTAAVLQRENEKAWGREAEGRTW